MNIKYKNIYFLGIGGIGMSALARYFKSIGANVSGYDKTKTDLTSKLENENIDIHYTEDISYIPKNIDVVIYTPAIPNENKELIHLKKLNIPILKRAQVIADISNNYYCIAVAGTHGKTTISSLITHILKHSNKNVLAFVGGIMKNYNSNIVYTENPKYCVVEADEYDRSFLNLNPNISIISAIDADHLDIYGNYENLKNAFTLFAEKTDKNGIIITHNNVKINIKHNNIKNYGINANNGINAKNIKTKNIGYTFDIFLKNECIIENINLPLAGKYNIENALSAIKVAISIGIKPTEIKEALTTFKGINRRFDVRINNEKYIYIDDYAHHPKEIESFIDGVINIFPNKKITGIFQPHLYSRTRDFASEFASSLEKLDKIIILDIYPARELPINGIDANFLINKINHKDKHYIEKDKLANFIEKIKPEVLLTIGAGDIDKSVSEIENIIKNLMEETA